MSSVRGDAESIDLHAVAEWLWALIDGEDWVIHSIYFSARDIAALLPMLDLVPGVSQESGDVSGDRNAANLCIDFSKYRFDSDKTGDLEILRALEDALRSAAFHSESIRRSLLPPQPDLPEHTCDEPF